MANLSIGIVGLPNVGKSTLFQALTAIAVPAENYPFCTIDPNVGVVEVPDPRLDRLVAMLPPRHKVSPVVEFVDIAGLVRGASQGEGLGNRFLGHVRTADALVHVLRAFEDEGVARADGSAGPIEELEVVQTELALADLEVVGRRRRRVEKTARAGDKEAAAEVRLLERVERALDESRSVRSEPLDGEQEELLRPLELLTLKPVVYVANLGENSTEAGSGPRRQLREAVAAREPGAELLEIVASLEAEVARLPPEEREEYAAALGLEASGLDRLIRAGYRALGLQTFFTIGDAEVRGWTVRVGARAPEAAGKVHTDFERGFIRAETIHFEDFVRLGSMKEARDRGALRSEGREYVVRDGDILFFRAAP